jgi:hypothetical protein
VHRGAEEETVSEQLPPAEHWRGHLDVPRPKEKVRPGRRFYLLLAASLVVGLLALGALALWSELAHRPNVLSWGVAIITGACLLLVVRFAMPLAIGPSGALGPSPYGEQPLPLITPALAAAAFGLPSLGALIVLTIVGLQAG